MPTPILILGVLLLGAGVFRLAWAPEARARHPEPRPGVTADSVAPSSRYADYPEIAGVYDEAARIPGVLDGLYCHCGCAEHSGHRSLLHCFQSDHGAGCDICLQEAHTAFLMTQEGASLASIRRSIDRTFADPAS